SLIILWSYARRYVLKQDRHFCPALSILKCDHHGHLSREGGVRRVKRYRLDDSCWGRELHEPCCETVFLLGGLATVHLLGCRIEQRHSISSANSGVEVMDLSGHLCGRKPGSQGFRVGK